MDSMRFSDHEWNCSQCISFLFTEHYHPLQDHHRYCEQNQLSGNDSNFNLMTFRTCNRQKKGYIRQDEELLNKPSWSWAIFCLSFWRDARNVIFIWGKKKAHARRWTWRHIFSREREREKVVPHLCRVSPRSLLPVSFMDIFRYLLGKAAGGVIILQPTWEVDGKENV